MKRKSIIVLIAAGILFAACNTNDLNESNICRRFESDSTSASPASGNEGDDYDLSSYEDLTVEQYVAENTWIFNYPVLIFDSEEEADSLLDVMEDLDYDDLRALYDELNYNNITIESSILLDSLFNQQCNIYGITDYDDISDE